MQSELAIAMEAARDAGQFLRSHFGHALEVNEMGAHDIKLAIDVQSQERIAQKLLQRFPDHALYGEEGVAGNSQSPWEWIVDPIDGTVNFYYGIPHFCISIALRHQGEVVLGIIYDPMRDELWSTTSGQPALLNGAPIRVSDRHQLSESAISVGLSKTQTTVEKGLPVFGQLVQKVRKCRMMGSAALDMAYIAAGRLDAYLEQMISLWDIAAGKLLIENAGGKVTLDPHDDNPNRFRIVAQNGHLPLDLNTLPPAPDQSKNTFS